MELQSLLKIYRSVNRNNLTTYGLKQGEGFPNREGKFQAIAEEMPALNSLHMPNAREHLPNESEPTFSLEWFQR